MSYPHRQTTLEEPLVVLYRILKEMPESRLAVLANFVISGYILTLVYTGDVGGLVGVTGVVAINGSTSGILYAFAQTLEEVENQQQA